jgi:hypothetical protein
MKINGIEVTSTSMLNCYKKYYPKTYQQLMQNKFDYLELFGIRVSTCDTSLPDDLIGGMKVNNFNFWEVVMSSGSTEPSPYWLKNLMSDARAKGGAAFVAEGQYVYMYMGKRHGNFKPEASFCPIKPVKVYRWTPTKKEIEDWKNGKGKPLSASFENAVKTKQVKISLSGDVCIHKSWAKEKFFNDSAGCQILSDTTSLNTLGDWADKHRKKKYGNVFQYTLFTKEQFVSANSGSSSIFSLLKNLY